MHRGARCESVTLFTHMGEGPDGVARYMATRVDGAAVFRRAGMRQERGQPLAGDDRAVVYVFDEAARVRRVYVDEDVFDALEDKDGYWTVHTDGRDRVYLGLSWDERPREGPRMLRPVSVVYNDQGRKGLRHLKMGLV